MRKPAGAPESCGAPTFSTLYPLPGGAGFGRGPSPSGFADGRAGYDARVEHRFSGPSYTLGVEEELMIVDAETLDLSNSIEGLLADLREPGHRVRSSRS